MYRFQISNYSVLSFACSVGQSEHMLFCKQDRDHALERSLSNKIQSTNYHKDPLSVKKKKKLTHLFY